MFWVQGAQGLVPWDPGVRLIRSASSGICVLIRIHLRSHSLDFLRSHSLDFLRSHSLDLVYFCVSHIICVFPKPHILWVLGWAQGPREGPLWGGGPGPRAQGLEGPRAQGTGDPNGPGTQGPPH